MQLSQHQTSSMRQFSVGSLDYYWDFKCLSSGEQSIYLRHKLNQVLQLLIKKQGETVTRQELIDIVWDGNSYCGQKALTHTICNLRKIFRQLGQTELLLVTIPKQGYSLIPVRLTTTE